MSAGIITQGIGPSGSIKHFLTLGLDLGAEAVVDLVDLTLESRSVAGTLGSRDVAGTLESRSASLTVTTRE